mgnify:FL=1
MKRSTFIKSSILGSIATISLNGIKLNSNPKISLSPWSIMRKGYGEIDPGGIDVYDYPMIAKELGFNYIEHEMFHFPKNLDDKSIFKMVNRCKEADIKSVLLLTGGIGDITDTNKKYRKIALEKYKRWMDIAHLLKCKSMRNVCADRITVSRVEKLKYAIEGVSELTDHGKKLNMDLLIENHNGYSSDPDWLVTLIKKVNSKNLGILGDFTNWKLTDNPKTFFPDAYKGFQIMSPYIRFVSAKSEKFNINGEEINTNYKKMFKILKNCPQLECIGVEFFGNEITRKKGISQTKNLIENSLSTIF